MKKLSNYIIDLGRAVAYYPRLNRLTGSIKATIFLCQFIYWSDKTNDINGWTYKDSDEIEEETGLTYNEQKTARDRLIASGILEEEDRRLQHKIRYRINHEELNAQWEALTGQEEKKQVVKKESKKEIPTGLLKGEQLPLPIISGSPIISDSSVLTSGSATVLRERRTDAKVKGDMLDGILAFNTPAIMKKETEKRDIKEQIESQLNIIADGARWDRFIDFVYNRQVKYKENIGTFLVWALNEGFNAVYWTPEKMRSLYPQAFVDNKPVTPRKDFVQKLPEFKEKDYVPMPKSITRKETD